MSGKSLHVYDTLKLLLDHGADVNGRDRLYGTALQAAIELFQNPGKAITRVHFLIKSSANINTGAGSYGFPLQSASVAVASDDGERFANPKILTWLFSNCPDSDVNMTGKLGTALQAAAYSSNVYALSLLIGDVETADATFGAYDSVSHDDSDSEDYGDFLSEAHHDAARAPHSMVDINARGGEYGSALNAAVVRGYWDIVEILLDASAKPDCHGQLELDEEWLSWVEMEDGKGAVERYRKFWEKQKLKLEARSGEEEAE